MFAEGGFTPLGRMPICVLQKVKRYFKKKIFTDEATNNYYFFFDLRSELGN